VVRVVLASASPRRPELLAALLDEFDIVPSDVPEEAYGSPAEDAVRLAVAKARAVAADESGAVVIGADTIVHDGSRAYGKPGSPGEAVDMLRALRGRKHTVYTGVSVIDDEIELRGCSAAEVELVDLTDAEIASYLASGRPLDKAGAYAIQDEDVPTVSALKGCYCCVVGLPLWRLRSLLEAAGVPCKDPRAAISHCRECPERGMRHEGRGMRAGMT